MRIAIVGSYCVGKSTLAKSICRRLGFNYIRDTAIDAFKKGFVINENTLPETQFWILSKQLELMQTTKEPWVSDKALYDNFVYGKFANQGKRVLEVIKDIIDRNANYDLIFYLPIEFSIVDNGIRSLDENFRRTIDKKILEYLKKERISYEVINGSLKERLERAIKVIKKLKKKKNL